MTGTERASLRAALGILRRDADVSVTYALHGAGLALRLGGVGWLSSMVAGLLDAWQPPRILRARLALYLRALLRAERGDMSRWTCPRHPGATVATDIDTTGPDGLWRSEWWCSTERRWRLVEAGNEPVRRASIARPLWTLTPSTPEPMK